ncbi:MAG: hypothetical protein COA79_06760 [Planctomycetota bacterium]|nr:MAG: hypothetical protein COA79_06760 [Planctomycetota bacterium]
MIQEVENKDVYEKYYRLIYSTCSRRLFDKSLLEDAIQATFLVYLKEQKKEKNCNSAWFYWTSKNVCTVMNRDVLKHKPISYVNFQVDQKFDTEIELDSLLSSLSDIKRKMILLRFYENKTYKDIGVEIGWKEDRVKKSVKKTLLNLRLKLRKEEKVFMLLLGSCFSSQLLKGAVICSLKSLSTFSIVSINIAKGVQVMIQLSKIKNMLIIVAILFLPPSAIVYSWSQYSVAYNIEGSANEENKTKDQPNETVVKSNKPKPKAKKDSVKELFEKGKKELKEAIAYTDFKDKKAQEKFKKSRNYFKKVLGFYKKIKNIKELDQKSQDYFITAKASIFYITKNCLYTK